MYLPGGMSESIHTPACIGWHSIIYPYQVFQLLISCSHFLILHSPPSATSVDVERVFSRGRILLSHIRNRLTVQSTRALMCLGTWSKLGLVKDSDVRAVTVLPEMKGDDDEVADDWDRIRVGNVNR